MDVHPTKNVINRYWSIAMSLIPWTSSVQVSVPPAAAAPFATPCFGRSRRWRDSPGCAAWRPRNPRGGGAAGPLATWCGEWCGKWMEMVGTHDLIYVYIIYIIYIYIYIIYIYIHVYIYILYIYIYIIYMYSSKVWNYWNRFNVETLD